MLSPILTLIPLLTLASAQSIGSCRNEYNGYCCHGSIITSDGSHDISKLICCEGDPIDNSINLRSAATCTAGSAVPLTQVATQSDAPGQTEVSGHSQFISAGDGTTLVVIDGSTVSGGASATAGMTGSMSSGSAMTGSMGSGMSMSMTSTATAAATSSGAAAATFESRSQVGGALVLVMGWLMAAL